ncbi:hypothetical protein HELRODRAFT_189243 [Helobdella robusta]|uniref:Ferric-chelate reductase 1 n=1 Tax=Helobdella robusta TaxID=6412 RepID=T1FQV0_HELRO|nr:hypothetical protein HELRODRAFT_189243 [Helobdella robusta]ESN96445.1 hypothetical protein HELRODRAFT_189243 [Helobdella robusta]
MILKNIIVLFSYLFVAVAFPGGAPEQTCTSLAPSHSSSFQTSLSSYIITTNQTGSTFIVSISSNKSENFTGFILGAFSSSSSTPIGVFTNVDSNTKQICQNPQGQAANGSFACPNQECVITWGTSAQSGYMDVSLQGRINEVTNYIAMAYSVDDEMGRDSVIACFKDPSTNQFKIILSYNGEEKSNVFVSMPSNFIINTSGDYVDGALKCKFSQLLIPFNDSSKSDKIFYPGDGNFYLLYATGPMNNGKFIFQFRIFQRYQDVENTHRETFFKNCIQFFDCSSNSNDSFNHHHYHHHNNHSHNKENRCAFTWSKSARAGYVDFKLEGPVKTKSDYIAIGFSLDDKMGDDSVVSCYLNGTSCAIRLSKNTGKTNSYVSPPSDTFIMDKSGEYVNGMLRCSYSQAMRNGTSTSSRRKKRAAGDTIFFPGDRNYYLLYATGGIQPNANDQLLAYHNSRFASSSALNLTDFAVTSVGSSKVSNSLIKAHGILMVIAWLMCASTGMLLPRYFKSAWKDSKLCKQAVWFRLHQVMMSSVFILTSIAFIIIFCERMGYASSTLGIDSAHPPLGIIVMILVFLNLNNSQHSNSQLNNSRVNNSSLQQPFMSLFRCAPTHKNRWLFNIAHLLVGQFALIIAVINIFLSFYMKMSNMNYGWVQWVMVALIVYHTCMEILLLAHDKYLNSPAHSSKSDVASSNNNFGFSEPRRETDWLTVDKCTYAALEKSNSFQCGPHSEKFAHSCLKCISETFHVIGEDNLTFEHSYCTEKVSIIKTILIICQWVGVTGLAIAICVGIGIAL